MQKNNTPQDSREKILIVDDERSNLNILADLLGQDYKIFVAKSGAQALDRVHNISPDLILLDVMMPDMDGYRVCYRLKSDESTMNIPVIFITSLDSLEDEEHGLKLGALDYITKPFSPFIVRARVKNIMTLFKQRKLLENLVNLDPLTEISNRRYYDRMLVNEYQRCLRNRSPISLAMMDIDCFKQYNDNYGHAAGDEALKQVSSLIVTRLNRPGDLVARYGGEEFVLLMPDTDSEGASLLAEEIRFAVEKYLSIPHLYTQTSANVLTVSIGGVTMMPVQLSGHNDLAKKADELLYQAKSSGRNQVVWIP